MWYLLANYYSKTDINTILLQYLPLSAGSSKALAGDLYMGTHAIRDVTDVLFNGSLTGTNAAVNGSTGNIAGLSLNITNPASGTATTQISTDTATNKISMIGAANINVETPAFAVSNNAHGLLAASGMFYVGSDGGANQIILDNATNSMILRSPTINMIGNLSITNLANMTTTDNAIGTNSAAANLVDGIFYFDDYNLGSAPNHFRMLSFPYTDTSAARLCYSTTEPTSTDGHAGYLDLYNRTTYASGLSANTDIVGVTKISLLSNLDCGSTQFLTGLPDPVNNSDAVNRQWVIAQIGAIPLSSYLKLDGSNSPMTGSLSTQNLLPDATATRIIGDTAHRYLSSYITTLNSDYISAPGGTLYIQSNANTRNLSPANTTTYSIGAVGAMYSSVYTIQVNSDGSDLELKTTGASNILSLNPASNTIKCNNGNLTMVNSIAANGTNAVLFSSPISSRTITPSANNTYDIGASGNQYKTAYIGVINNSSFYGTTISATTGLFNVLSSPTFNGSVIQNLTGALSISTGSTYNLSLSSGAALSLTSTGNISLNSTTNIIDCSNDTLNNVLGIYGASNVSQLITYNGFTPDVDNMRSIGGASNRYKYGYFVTTQTDSIGGSAGQGYMALSTDLHPTHGTSVNIGDPTYYFLNGYFGNLYSSTITNAATIKSVYFTNDTASYIANPALVFQAATSASSTIPAYIATVQAGNYGMLIGTGGSAVGVTFRNENHIRNLGGFVFNFYSAPTYPVLTLDNSTNLWRLLAQNLTASGASNTSLNRQDAAFIRNYGGVATLLNCESDLNLGVNGNAPTNQHLARLGVIHTDSGKTNFVVRVNSTAGVHESTDISPLYATQNNAVLVGYPDLSTDGTTYKLQVNGSSYIGGDLVVNNNIYQTHARIAAATVTNGYQTPSNVLAVDYEQIPFTINQINPTFYSAGTNSITIMRNGLYKISTTASITPTSGYRASYGASKASTYQSNAYIICSTYFPVLDRTPFAASNIIQCAAGETIYLVIYNSIGPDQKFTFYNATLMIEYMGDAQ